jgi:hypothetical protein
LFPPGLEPGTFRVLGERDNHYTTETGWFENVEIAFSPVSGGGIDATEQRASRLCEGSVGIAPVGKRD